MKKFAARVVGIILIIIRYILSGCFGCEAWNMAIPVIWPNMPSITMLQALIISTVIKTMCFFGTGSGDSTSIDGHPIATELQRIENLFIVCFALLLVLCVLMKIYVFLN